MDAIGVFIGAFSLIIGGYPAAVSTILGMRELQRDRRRIGVILEYDPWYGRLQVTITNVGHRPITITEVGFDLAGDPVPRNALFAPEVKGEPLPITLADAEPVTLPLSEVLADKFREDHGMHWRIAVYDVEGNVYKKFKIREHDRKWGYYREITE